MWVCMLLHANLLSFLLPLKHIFWYENMKGEIKMKDYYPEGTLIANEENKKYLSSEAFLQLAISSEKILEANVVMCDAEHNLIVDLGIMRGIIPRDEGAIGIREGTTRDIALISRVGRAVSFIVKEITNDSCGKKQAVLSRRIAQEKCLDYIIENLSIGDIVDARITHLESFGAFCDIGCGNVALLPIDAISVSRIAHPKDRFFVGDKIRAIIKNIDNENKITLSHKELLGTWQENAEQFSQGQTVSGVVRSVENYGVFVELTPNLAGLAESKDNVVVGQNASVYIKSIIPEKMKIKLIIIDSFDAPIDNEYKYYFEGEHIDEFLYSPPNSAKQICTKF